VSRSVPSPEMSGQCLFLRKINSASAIGDTVITSIRVLLQKVVQTFRNYKRCAALTINYSYYSCITGKRMMIDDDDDDADGSLILCPTSKKMSL